MQDVRDALAAGKTVTISQRSVTVANWTGTGYIITNPNTGAGSYLIGGGADGGWVTSDHALLLSNLASFFAQMLAYPQVGYKPMFGSTLIKNALLSKLAGSVSVLAFAVALAFIFSNDSLTLDQKIGQASLALLAQALIVWLVSSIGLAGGALFAAGAGIILILSFAVILPLLSDMYFSGAE